MKKLYVFILLLISVKVFADDPRQTIRGQIIDKESKYPLMYATVILYKDSMLVKGVTSDSLGNFRIDDIKIGAYNIKVAFLGYNPAFLQRILVNSGKETILNIELEENRRMIKEIEVNGMRKDQTVNEMSLISARTFTVDEANRYAGSRSDPGRMASNYAGVQGTDDSRNDIVIRGNSPLGVIWRINGSDFANPNHFAIPGTTGGGVTMLNTKTFNNSDFLTGAFSAEYGNTISGVFDLRLRNGNNEKHEYTGQFGFLGTELTAEGPIKREEHSSYLAAYRYSTLKLFEALNINIGTEAIPNYQDLTFKLNFPGKKGGNFSLYGIGGTSNINIKVSEQKNPVEEIYGEKDKDQYFKTSSGMIGAGKAFNINAETYAHVNLTYQLGEAVADDDLVYRDQNYEVDSIVHCLGYTFKNKKTSFNAVIVRKINSRLTFKSGINADYLTYDLIDSNYIESTYKFVTRLDAKRSTYPIQPYALVKYKISDRLNMNAGIHTQFLTLTNSHSIEPRLGLKYNLNDVSTISFGFGKHSQMQPYYVYFHQVKNAKGEFVKQNENLSFTRSNHYVLGYDLSLKNNSRIKAEIYYMSLYNVPVSVNKSTYSILNEGASFSRFFPGSLTNKGIGKNMGLEITYEKFFSENYFVLVTGSLFDSKYKGSDGVERNTAFNGVYAFNVLAGKDYKLSDHTSLTSGFKLTQAGGKRFSPVDTMASRLAGELVEVDSLRNSLQFRDYFRFDLRIGIKINSRHLTHELAFDLVNVFGTKNILSLTYVYDPRHPEINPVKEEYQLGFLPLFYYKVDF